MDKHFWLHDPNDPRTIEYLKKENEYTEKMMGPTRDFQEALFTEMRGRIKEKDRSVPVKRGDYLYYFRWEVNRQYGILCRMKAGDEAAEEIMLDLNDLAAGQPFCELGAYSVSPDQRFLAYSIDFTGRENYVLHIKDLQAGRELPETIEGTYKQAIWANDSRTLYYTTLDAKFRPYCLKRRTVGGDNPEDIRVYRETDEAFRISLYKTRSGKYIFMRLESQVTTEVYFLDADHPDSSWTLVEPRRFGIEYYLLHQGESFIILTNDKAVNFRMMEAPVESPARLYWKEIVPHRSSAMIEDAEVFRHHIVLHERESGNPAVRVMDRRTGEDHYIDFPDQIFSVWSGRNPEYDTTLFRFVYSSFVMPESTYEYDMDKRTRRLLKRDEVKGGFDSDQYRSDRIFAFASDGAMVPISLVYRKGMKRDGNTPMVLYGYGAYGVSFDPEFDSNLFSLLDRGVIYAIAHVRGGSELGRMWYENGKLMQKRNSFTDFITCAEHLVAQKYTSPDRLIIKGHSAGGLLIATVVNMRPDLFAAAVADMPFVDVVQTMQDNSMPLTVTEYDEWGNPHDKTVERYLVSYSPIDNVEEQDYPNMLIRAGFHDARVNFWEPAKWAMRLREYKTDDNLLLLHTNFRSGHFGPSGWLDHLRETAFEYTFILDMLGLVP